MKPLIVITGASSGIGEAAARQLSALGHPLLLLARRIDKLHDLCLPNTLCEQVDVTDQASFQNAVDKAVAQFGPVNCLINNAGVMLLGLIHEQNSKEWQTMFNVNVLGLLNGIGCVLKNMCEQNNGTIINISSIAGRKTFPNHAAYCGTKFAVHAISENIREEVAPYNVRVTLIAPGAVETDLLSHTTSASIKENYQEWKDKIGGAISAEDVARAIIYAYQQPQNICVREVVLATTKQEP